MLLGNGDEVRRCRDAHTEGQTIEESLRASPYSWRRRFNSNQVPLIPASRRHDYANDLPPPSWLPPFFPSTLTCAQQQQNSTALKAVPPLRCANCRPIYTRSSHFSACFFPLHCICPFTPVLFRHTPGASSGTFPTRFPSSKLEAGQGGSS
jgi:hypothetical protein